MFRLTTVAESLMPVFIASQRAFRIIPERRAHLYPHIEQDVRVSFLSRDTYGAAFEDSLRVVRITHPEKEGWLHVGVTVRELLTLPCAEDPDRVFIASISALKFVSSPDNSGIVMQSYPLIVTAISDTGVIYILDTEKAPTLLPEEDGWSEHRRMLQVLDERELQKIANLFPVS